MNVANAGRCGFYTARFNLAPSASDFDFRIGSKSCYARCSCCQFDFGFRDGRPPFTKRHAARVARFHRPLRFSSSVGTRSERAAAAAPCRRTRKLTRARARAVRSEAVGRAFSTHSGRSNFYNKDDFLATRDATPFDNAHPMSGGELPDGVDAASNVRAAAAARRRSHSIRTTPFSRCCRSTTPSRRCCAANSRRVSSARAPPRKRRIICRIGQTRRRRRRRRSLRRQSIGAASRFAVV